MSEENEVNEAKVEATEIKVERNEEGEDDDTSSQGSHTDSQSESKTIEKFLANKLSSTKWIKLRDKIFFILGVANIIVLSLGIFEVHWILPYYYTVKAPILIGSRFFMYKRHKWHLFLLDFCYFGNTMLLIYMWVAPFSAEFFSVVFALSWAPLLCAVITFRNSLVFHSSDKLTSCFIHISPPLTTFVIRYYPQELNNYWYTNFQPCLDTVSGNCYSWNFDKFLWFWFVPLGVFIGHSFFYYILVNLILGKKLKRDRDYLYSFRYLTADKDGFFFKAVNLFGKRGRIFMYGVVNWMYCLLTLLPVVIWVQYQVAAIVFGCLIILICTWNGANFYVEVFSRGAYEKAVKRSEFSGKQ